MRMVIGLLLGLATLAAISYLAVLKEGEPVYRGTSLTQWLKRLDDGQVGGISFGALPSPTARQVEAAEAIRAMGAEALPRLMEDIHATPAQDGLRFRAERSLNHVLERVLWKRISFEDITQEDRRRWRAAQGLAALGPIAKPAVPELKRLLLTNYFHSSIKEAAYVLATVGPEGIEILTNAPQANEWSGMCAIWALGQHPETGTNAIPFLISATSSSSEGTACGAIQVLGLFHTEGDQVIPALTAALASAKPSVRSDAARALGAFGPQASAAVPRLRELANDPAAGSTAVEALRRIQGTAAQPKSE
ncbi:putative HEAT domain containing protein [Verrucomicrobia bacterium]|nr:putative HEAT domain containing protein [Verrucomicrobiota bacterium]